MLPEGTKTCRLCGHVLWRDEEEVVCVACQHTWHVIAQAHLEILPNKACSGRLSAASQQALFEAWKSGQSLGVA